MLPDDELVEVVPIQVDPGESFFDVSDPAAPPASAQAGQPPEGGPPSTPEGAGPPVPGEGEGAGPQVPEWLAEIPEADRASVLGAALSALSPEQRVQLAPVRELLGAVQANTAAQVQNQQYEQNQAQYRQNQLQQQSIDFINNLSAWAPSDVNLQAEAQQLVQVAQSTYHSDITGRIEQGLLRGLARVGLGPNNLPPTLLARVNSAPDYGSVVQAYIDATADAAFELGKVKSRSESGESLKAETTAARARARNEALGELAKEGRLRLQKDGDDFLATLLDQTPPSLSGSPVASGPSEIEEAEFNEAMSDPDAYERLMKDPVKAAALHKLMAGVMA